MTAVVITELERCIIDQLRTMSDIEKEGVCRMVDAPRATYFCGLKSDTEADVKNRQRSDLNWFHAAGYKGKPAFGIGPVQMIVRKLDGEEE